MFDSCVCVDPEEVCTLLRRRQMTARKTHECGECGCKIKPGDIYESDETVIEGNFAVYKTCIVCVRIRDSLFDCGWYYGRIWKDIHDAYCDGDDCVCS